MTRRATTGIAGLALSALATAGTVVAVAQPASAAPTWVDAVGVVDTGDDVTQLRLDGGFGDPSTGRSSTAAVWVDAATDDIVMAAHPVGGGSWTAPTLVATPPGTPDLVAAVRDDGIYYTVGDDLYLVKYPGSGAVQPRLLSGSVVPGTVSVGFDALWAENVAGGQRLVLGGAGFDAPVEMQPAAPVTYLETAVGNTEEATELAWISRTAGGTPRVSVAAPYAAPTTISPVDATAEDVAFESYGTTRLTWTQRSGTDPAQVQVGEYDGHAWRVDDVSGGPGAAAQPAIAHGDHGNVAVWRETNGAAWTVRTATQSADGGSWTPPVALASGTGHLPASHFQAAALTPGMAIAAWCRPATTGCTMQAAPMPAMAGGRSSRWGTRPTRRT